MRCSILSVDRLAILALFFSSFSLAAPTAEAIVLEKRALPVLMGLAKSFGALAGSTLTSTGETRITGTGLLGLGVGNGGVWPGTAITGFPPGRASGSLARGNTLARNGQAACLAAYNKYVSLLPIGRE